MAKTGEIRSHDRVSPAVKFFEHVNGTHTELALWIGGPTGKLYLPIEVLLLTPEATYQLVFHSTDRDGNEIVGEIETRPATDGASPIALPSCPYRLHADSDNGVTLICRY